MAKRAAPAEPTVFRCPVCQEPYRSIKEVPTAEATIRHYEHEDGLTCVAIQPKPLSKEAQIVRALVKVVRTDIGEPLPPGEGRVAAMRAVLTAAGVDYDQFVAWCEGVPTDDILK